MHLTQHPLARNSDPITSHAAADSARVSSIALREQILSVLASRGPQGAEQIGDALGLHAHEIRRRTSDLQKDGLIEPTGEERQTRRKKERVWRLVPEQRGLF